MDKKDKKRKFWTPLILVVVIIFVLGYGYHSFRMIQGRIMYDKETKDIIQELNDKYEELSIRFSNPQKVVGVIQTGRFLELEGGILLSFVYPGEGSEIYDKFYIYSKDNLIGQYVDVILPPKEIFTDYPNSIYGEMNSQESIQASVYFQGKSLNDAFSFIDPTIFYHQYFNK